ncbi:MAG: hypothetical protein ABIR38_01000 [Chthoniobacterales bacterium]
MSTRAFLSHAVVLAVLGTNLPVLRAEAETGSAPGDLSAAGKVDFPISCSSQVKPEFNRAVALLHSFFYEESRRIFTALAEQDPKCAMAQWGIAMTWWHPIWTPPNPDEMSAGTAAIDKAMSMAPGSDRERRFIAALHAYYHAPDGPARKAVGQSCHGPVGSCGRLRKSDARAGGKISGGLRGADVLRPGEIVGRLRYA